MIEMGDISEQELNTILLGEEIERFLGANIGQFLVNKAISEETALIAALKTINPANSEEIHRIQTEIRICTRCLAWLKQGLQEGKQTLKNIEEREKHADD